MQTIWFETHATSLDNEAGLASGHYDVDLSPAGVEQAIALGRRYDPSDIDLVLTSDLRRAWRTVELAFGDRARVHRDVRLRECDYGQLTRVEVRAIDAVRLSAVTHPFPGGESYQASTERTRRCLENYLATSSGDLLIVGHRATYYALEHLLNAVPLATVVEAPWRWQPGWRYQVRGGEVKG
ncbi:MAG TPA: histidine phosphatase family protein [Vicinamibacterales bacterium]|nr:histidine phosphatase family protein [Vicinamibacterales bacterium]